MGLCLADPGFDFSILSELRTRLIAGTAEERVLSTLLTGLRGRGLLKDRGMQRTDSTHIVAAVRALNRLEIVGETLHAALHVWADLAPDWLREQGTAGWFLRYGKRGADDQLPKATGDRQALAATIGRDGMQFLTVLSGDTAPAS